MGYIFQWILFYAFGKIPAMYMYTYYFIFDSLFISYHWQSQLGMQQFKTWLLKSEGGNDLEKYAHRILHQSNVDI